jgi:hypothetical protein
MIKEKSCPICGEKKHHCTACEEICAGCVEEQTNPQNCLLCRNQGYLGNPKSGPLSTCPNCPKGARLKLWIVHERRRGVPVPKGFVELVS